MDKIFLNIRELSLYLNLKESNIYSKVEAGELPHYRIGRLIRFKRDDIDRWLEGRRKDAECPESRAKLILRSVPKATLDGVLRKSIDAAKSDTV